VESHPREIYLARATQTLKSSPGNRERIFPQAKSLYPTTSLIKSLDTGALNLAKGMSHLGSTWLPTYPGVYFLF
jgi:hypothetical protein